MGATDEELCAVLIGVLPDWIDRRVAHAQVEAAYDIAKGSRPDLDSALDRPNDLPR